jgi:hypothetical protein
VRPEPRAAFRFGAIAGANLTRFSFSEPSHLPLAESSYGRALAFLVGGMVRRHLPGPLFLQSGIGLDVKGEHIEYPDQVDLIGAPGLVSGTSEGSIKLYYLALPLQLGVTRRSGNLRPYVVAGPEFDYLLTARETWEFSGEGHHVSASTTTTDQNHRFDLSLGAGVGLAGTAFRHEVFAGIAYSRGVVNVNDTLNRSSHHYYNEVVRLAVGIWR